MAVVFFIALAVVVGFHFGTGICPTHCKAGQTCDADDNGCPECEQVYYGRQCQHRMECRFTARGTEYRGLRNTTYSGKTCQRWDSQSPHPHKQPVQEENYCRNPDGELEPWCYTTDINSRYEMCSVKMCNTQCLSPPLNASGLDVNNPQSDGFAVGFNAVIGCMTGYETSGSPATVTVTCQSSMTWTQSPLPTCSRVQCPSPSLAENNQINNTMPTYKYEDQVIIVCNAGYTIQGQSILTCQADKSWRPSPPTCKINECPAPEIVANSAMSGDKAKYVYRDAVTITCDNGYTLQGQGIMTCQADKTWSNAPTCARVQCPLPSLAENSQVINPKPPYKYEDQITIVCITGYTLQGQSTLTCEQDKSWNASVPVCNIIECPAPESVPNGSILESKTKYVNQDIVTMKCNNGYTLQGQENITCQADKTWSTAPSCKINECLAPEPVANSSMSGNKAKYVYRDAVTITCNKGYTLQGQGTMTCEANKSWSNAPTCAKVKCPQFSQPNSNVSNPKPEYEYQDTITIVCDTGYTLKGQNTLTCQADKSWSTSFPTCSINECQSPAAVGNGSISGKKDKYVYKDSVTIVCNIGYTIAGQETIQCLADKTWSTAPTCDRVKCRQPPLKANSQVSEPKSEYKYQDSISIVCNVGYFLKGQNNLTCQADASWKPSVPVCITNACDQPKLRNNSKMVVTKRTFQRGDTVEFLCETGFIIQGPTQLTCLGNKTWDMEPPTCKLAECTLPSLPGTMKLQNPKHNYFYGDYITFFCMEGHEFQGRNASECKVTAQWSEPFPVCEKIKCVDLKLFSNVLISSPKKNKYSYNDRVSFQCEEGFKLTHNHNLVCQANKLWDKEEPFCFEIYDGLSTSQWVGVTIGSNLVFILLAIVVTVLIMRRFIARGKKNVKPPASVIRTSNAAFNEYDVIDVNKKEEPHIYNLPD